MAGAVPDPGVTESQLPLLEAAAINVPVPLTLTLWLGTELPTLEAKLKLVGVADTLG